MLLVLDSTPLIHFSRTGFLQTAFRLNHEFVTTPQVVDEVLPKGVLHPGAQLLKESFENGKIGVKPFSGKTPEHHGISASDASVIHLAQELRAIAVADDREVRLIAQMRQVKTVNSTALLIEAVRRKLVSQREGITWLDRLIASGWYCDAQTYALIAKAILQE
ncbi:hypothetical protein HY095_00145 [Candidatus Micrarchaeota archaeon]|nr:hypothetical protein [Candidatus Micrarchaeota archaeon]